MTSRHEVYNLIETERLYQESTFSPSEVLESGLTREQRDSDVMSHLVLLDQYVEKAKAAWVPKGSSLESLKQIAKIAAIAVRALENVPGTRKLVSSRA